MLNQERGHPFSTKMHAGEGDEERHESNRRKCKVRESCPQETLQETKCQGLQKKSSDPNSVSHQQKAEILPWLHPDPSATQLNWGVNPWRRKVGRSRGVPLAWRGTAGGHTSGGTPAEAEPHHPQGGWDLPAINEHHVQK